MAEQKIDYETPSLPDRIKDEYLIDKYAEEDTKIKLKPVKDDKKPMMIYKKLRCNIYDFVFCRFFVHTITNSYLFPSAGKKHHQYRI